MTTASLRARYLAALGISGSLLSACSSTEPGGTTPTAMSEPTTVATAEVNVTATATTTVANVDTAPPTATATATPTATAMASVAWWKPAVSPPAPKTVQVPDDRLPRASCPSGAFCIAEADAIGSTMAPNPFGKCGEDIRDPMNPDSERRSIHFNAEQTKRERTKTKDACCYTWFIPCPGGRPLIVDGVARVAEPARSEAWASAGTIGHAIASLSPENQLALADHYTTEATYEHASIAAFARVSLALLALGAPSDLVADTHRAALDETRHAEAMFRVASALRGEAIGPGPLSLDGASLSASLVELASEAFIEGCVGEVAAALVLREEAACASDPGMREVLSSIASDEERHAELAWRTVGWALSQAPAEIGPALARQREAVVLDLDAELPAEGRTLPGVLSARGRLTVRRQAIREVVLPCLDALLAASSVRVGEVLLDHSVA